MSKISKERERALMNEYRILKGKKITKDVFVTEFCEMNHLTSSRHNTYNSVNKLHRSELVRDLRPDGNEGLLHYHCSKVISIWQRWNDKIV